MATFNLMVGGTPRGVELTKKADGVVLMGALLVKGTADGDVKEASSGTYPWAVSLVDERVSTENEAEQYSDNEPVRLMTLVSGMVLNLKASGAISEGDTVVAAANGAVTSGTGSAVIGRALEAIADGERGMVVIQLPTAA